MEHDYSEGEMGSDGWELLGDEGFFDVADKDFVDKQRVLDGELLLNVNYFVDPSVFPLDSRLAEESEGKVATDLVPSALKIIDDDEILKLDEEEILHSPPVLYIHIVKDMKEIIDTKIVETPQFVDMKVETLVCDPIIDNKDPFPDLSEFIVDEKNDVLDLNSFIKEEKNEGGFMIWRWRLHGIGALCSLGIAAATICIIIFGRRRQKQHRYLQKGQKIGFDAYADDSRIKQVVHHAGRLNQAISSGRGVPFTGARISFGGYYNGI